MYATPSFLFPQLRNKVCVFPDKLQALETSVEVPNGSYEYLLSCHIHVTAYADIAARMHDTLTHAVISF